MRIAVLNGPNLNLLGTREPEVYGTTTLADIETRLGEVASELGVQVECEQHNGEGALIDAVHRLRGRVQGALLNAGAYTHTSLALRDAFTAVAVGPGAQPTLGRAPRRHVSAFAMILWKKRGD